MKRTIRYSLLLLALLTLTLPATAKGPVDMITITGPGIDEPIEITDPEILSRFDPWAGQFLGTGGPLEVAPAIESEEPYQIFFYLRDNSGELQLDYAFDYYPNPTDERAYIYLPGPVEPYYEVNTGSIIRDDSDGRWHIAMPTWDAMFQEQLQASGVSLDGNSRIYPVSVFWMVAILGIAIIGGIGLWFIRSKAQRPNRTVRGGIYS